MTTLVLTSNVIGNSHPLMACHASQRFSSLPTWFRKLRYLCHRSFVSRLSRSPSSRQLSGCLFTLSSGEPWSIFIFSYRTIRQQPFSHRLAYPDARSSIHSHFLPKWLDAETFQDTFNLPPSHCSCLCPVAFCSTHDFCHLINRRLNGCHHAHRTLRGRRNGRF